MRITMANKEAVKYACLKFHYAKSVPLYAIAYNVYNDKNEWCGVVLYGLGANNNIGNEYGLCQGEIMELQRVALNGKQEHTSQAISLTLRQIKKNVPALKLIVSYADCDQNHLGTIYQATNWVYVGDVMTNKADSSFIINGRRVHGRVISDLVKQKGGLNGLSREEFIQKHFDKDATKYITKGRRKYLMPLNKQTRKKILRLAKPYPKGESWTKIDRSQFQK